MSLSEKLKSVKTGLAVLVAGAMISGVAYAKEIKDEGWSLPDKTKYYQFGEPTIKEVQYEHEGKTLILEIQEEGYAGIPESQDAETKIYKKFSFENQAFMYVILQQKGHSDAYDLTVLVDRDGNGSMETKYTDSTELEKDGIPEWVLDKAEKSQKTEID